MILVSYDGSPDAQAAIDRAALLMPGVEAVVLTVWEPFLDVVARTGAPSGGMGLSGSYADDEEIDTNIENAALATATEGAERGAAAGLGARPRAVRRHGGIANTILAAAADEDAEVIVLGTRGRSEVKSFLLGSVSHAVVQHADRAVLVALSPSLADQRREWVGNGGSPG